MTMEPRVIRTLKKSFDDDHFINEADQRKQISDNILEIIYSKVMARHIPERTIGKGVRALIDDDPDP